jgi:hypothetical protein
MTRTKHIAQQVILDNTRSNARARLVKVAKTQTITNAIKERDDRLIKETRSLLRKRKKKSHRFKSKSITHRSMFLLIFLLIDYIIVVFKEIKRYQKFVDLLMLKLSMRRLMKELTLRVKFDIRFQIAATNALRETIKTMLIN